MAVLIKPLSENLRNASRRSYPHLGAYCPYRVIFIMQIMCVLVTFQKELLLATQGWCQPSPALQNPIKILCAVLPEWGSWLTRCK